MANRSAQRWVRAYMAASFVVGVSVIVISLLDHDPWWSWLSHLLFGVGLVALATVLFAATGHGRQRKLKERSRPQQ
ncbi:hypothetical protein [Streptomyces sp. NBC_01089]|uniref:hypothetical protein n=1 Tax=Streptomyces sp. NBC_01089 TaxID=2903747 RepID=UPI00386ED737|nr:hypothetical protein OG510_17485 [Streptomyces sp. NBC_01089]